MTTRHVSASRAVLFELVTVALFLPLLTMSAVGLFVLPLWAGVVATFERSRARAVGADIPDSRHPGMSRGAHLGARAVSRKAWALDLPVLGYTIMGGFFSFVMLVLLLSTGVVLLGAPLIVHQNAGDVQVLGWKPGFAESFVLMPLGALALVALWFTMRWLGSQHLLVLRTLTDDPASLRAELGRLTSSRATLVEAFEAERRRIERDLHDGAQQRLVALTMTLGRAARVARREPGPGVDEATAREELASRIEEAQSEAEAALVELRGTVRGIHPKVLSDRGLFAAVSELATRSGLDVRVTTAGSDDAVASPSAAGAYFAVSEALTNVARHSGVATASVDVQVTGGCVTATVTDAGRGGAGIGRVSGGVGTGLAGLAERLETLGGSLVVDSPPAGGTRLVAQVPEQPRWGG